MDNLQGEAGWLLTHDIGAGSTEFHMASYAGLAICDLLEIDSGTPNAEVVVNQRFASVHLVFATRHPRRRGATVRRLVETWARGTSRPSVKMNKSEDIERLPREQRQLYLQVRS